jgi:anthranilate 1,2-dioxygenase small subunit
MELEIARKRIEALVHDYAHCIDDDRLEEWPGFFTVDCRYQIIDRESRALGRPVGFITCDSRDMLRDRVLSLREANVYEPHCYRHLISAVRVRGEAGGVYDVETGYAVIRTMQDGEMTVFSAGKYVDKVVFEAGSPRFRERIVVCDSARIDTLIVIPI